LAIRNILTMGLLLLALAGCATKPPVHVMSELAQGQREFDQGYYKRAIARLLPLACEGNAEAQYAIGYMYYYGYGVTQDTDVGVIWIKSAAAKHYEPAIAALKLVEKPGK